MRLGIRLAMKATSALWLPLPRPSGSVSGKGVAMVAGGCTASPSPRAFPRCGPRIVGRSTRRSFPCLYGAVYGVPIEHAFHERIIAVASGDASRGIQIVSVLKLHAGDFFHHGCQIVDRDQFARTEVDGRGNQPVAVHNLVDAEHAVFDEAEAARLCTVAPDIDSGFAAVEGFDHLTAERGRRFLTASEPGAVGAEDVVEAGDVSFQTAFLPILLAEHLRPPRH